MSNEPEAVRVQLARIEGKMDLSNLRHDRTEERLTTIDKRLHQHSSHIGNLQAANTLREGEAKGIAKTVKVAWLLGGSGATALVMATLRKTGLL